MWASRVVPYLGRVLQTHGKTLTGRVPQTFPATCFSVQQGLKNYSTAADNTPPPRWIQLEPELEEVLVPRKLSVSPLESWLSMRYSLPPLLEAPQPLEEVELLEEKVLPPIAVPILEDEIGSATPLQCKNVLEIRRRKINRHKYRKFQKRIRFLKKKVLEGRARKKQENIDILKYHNSILSHDAILMFYTMMRVFL
uniref:Small ribosomal subunit protein mS38 n=1 Tax=Cynoglossus semilaevis TaxID=244447 RepID=A0A3P8VA12_CYNSE